MAISAVGTSAGGYGDGFTLSYTPNAIGNLLVAGYQLAGASPITGMSGGGITWYDATDYTDTGGDVAFGIWYGVVTSTSAMAITPSGGAYSSSSFMALGCQEFQESTAGLTWTLAAASPSSPGTSGGPSGSGYGITLPGLSPQSGADSLYFGYAASYYGGMEAGSTAGCIYENPPNNSSVMFVYDPTATSALAPTATQTSTGSYAVIAAMFAASASGSGLLMASFP